MKVGRGSMRGMLGRVLLVCAVVCFVLGLSEFVRAPAAHAASSAKALRKQGAVVFHEKGCEHCHGVDGIGTQRGPNLSGVGRTLHKPEIEKQIREGGKEMPPYGDSLSNDEVQQLVEFLAAKKKRHVARFVEPAPGPAVSNPNE